MPDNKPKPLPPLTQSDVDRFWSKVVTGSADECWPWMGSCSRSGGYPTMWIGPANIIATRVAWFLANQVDPFPFLIRHTCDHPWCINPKHLLPGTHKDNAADALARNRHNVEFAKKIPDSEVPNVLADRAGGMTILALAAKYHVTPGAIIPMIKGRTRRYIIGPREAQKKWLTPEQRVEIIAKRAAGATLRSLALEYKKSIGAIGMLCSGETWKRDGKPQAIPSDADSG